MTPITDQLADALRRLANLAEDTINADGALRIGVKNARETLAAYEERPRCGDERYELDAYIWKRESTQEWVLEVSGSINGTDFIVRHPEPLTTSPEDAVGLPTLYSNIPQPESARGGEKLTACIEGIGLAKMALLQCNYGKAMEALNATSDRLDMLAAATQPQQATAQAAPGGDALIAKLPSLKTLDAVDDDLLRGTRPCPLNNLTISDVRLLHRILATHTARSEAAPLPAQVGVINNARERAMDDGPLPSMEDDVYD